MTTRFSAASFTFSYFGGSKILLLGSMSVRKKNLSGDKEDRSSL